MLIYVSRFAVSSSISPPSSLRAPLCSGFVCLCTVWVWWCRSFWFVCCHVASNSFQDKYKKKNSPVHLLAGKSFLSTPLTDFWPCVRVLSCLAFHKSSIFMIQFLHKPQIWFSVSPPDQPRSSSRGRRRRTMRKVESDVQAD